VAALQNTNLRYMLRVITEFIDLPPRRRLAARLNRLAGRERDPRPLHISQQGLAEMLGCTRKTVTGYLSEFEKLNLITVGYTRIDIRDREGLRKIATAK
jgi:CRP-like cAMP-binding protein